LVDDESGALLFRHGGEFPAVQDARTITATFAAGRANSAVALSGREYMAVYAQP
jgi:hypothetical protein